MWRHRASYLAIAPPILLFAVFGIYPLVYTIVLSFYSWDGGRGPWIPAGLNNYTRLLRDEVFLKSLGNSAFYWATLVPMLVGGSLLLAALLDSPGLKGRSIFRTTMFLPYITSGLIMAMVIASLLDDKFGWVNGLLQSLGVAPVPWIRSTEFSKVSVESVIVWRNLGYFMVIFLAGLQSIDRELYEAAAIDGAGAVQTFFAITLPLLRPITIFVLIVSSNLVLNMFEVVFGMTQGGPQYSSQPLMLTLFQTAFVFGRFGAGAALAVVLSLITLTIALIQIKLIRGVD
jgi:cellobiose transport system permease protein